MAAKRASRHVIRSSGRQVSAGPFSTEITPPRSQCRRFRSSPSGNSEVMELLNIYTRLLLGATMILAALCALIEQVGCAL